MWITHDSYFCLITTVFSMMVIDMCKEFCYSLTNRNKYENMGIRFLFNPFSENIIYNLDSDMTYQATYHFLPLPGDVNDSFFCI